MCTSKTPRLCCRHSTPKRRMLLWTICTKLPGVEGKHTHKKTCFYLWRDYSFRKLFPSKPISLSIEKMWCRVKKLTACLLIIEPFASCYGLNRGGIGHEERGAFSLLEVRNLLAGCNLSHNEKQEENMVSYRLRSSSGGRSTQIKYLSKSTDTYYKILLQ